MEILCKAIHSRNSPNLILYGDKYSPLYSHLHSLLNDSCNLNYLQDSKELLGYRSTRLYHEFDISMIKHKNYSVFKTIVNDIIHRDLPFSEKNSKYVVFRDYNNVKSTIQGYLRVIVEKWRLTTRFVFLTHSYMSIHEAIRSRSLGIRFPRTIQVVQNDIYRRACEPLFKIYQTPEDHLSVSTIHTLKDSAYKILKYPFDISEVCKTLCHMIAETAIWSNNHKHYLISYIVQFQARLKLSYRKIIHLEALFLTLWDLTHHAYYDLLTANDKVDRDDEKQVHVFADTARIHENHKHKQSHVDVRHDIGDRI